MTPLHVELVAADRKVWEGDATQVIARATEGDMGILPGHAPLMAMLASGDVRIDTVDGGSRRVSVDSGFMTVENDRVIIAAHAVGGLED